VLNKTLPRCRDARPWRCRIGPPAMFIDRVIDLATAVASPDPAMGWRSLRRGNFATQDVLFP
jgi:hypothetical protein